MTQKGSFAKLCRRRKVLHGHTSIFTIPLKCDIIRLDIVVEFCVFLLRLFLYFMSKKTVSFFKVVTSLFLILSFFITPVSLVFAQEAPASTDTSSLQQTTTDNSPEIITTDPIIPEEIVTPPDPVKKETSEIDQAYLDPTSPLYDPEHKEPEDITSDVKDPEESASRSATVSQNALILNSNAQRDAIRPEIDQTTGALVYSYPIETPDGVNGLNPNVKLSYNSQNTKNDSVYGYGWSSNIPYIERVNKHGTEVLYTGAYDDYVSSTFGELVKDTSTHYVPKSASDIVDFSFNSNVWTYTDKQGTVYTYGATSASRQDDPGNASNIYKWMLSSVTDSNGNTITYTYLKDQGQIYPYIINYGIYELGFNLQARTDVTDSYAKGFAVRTRFVLGNVSLRKVTSPTSSPTVQASMLVVGGGGGGGAGGSNRGHYGGGGAGGYKYFANQSIVPASGYPVVIGVGGVGNYNAQGLNGSSTSFNNIVASGGGGGGTYNTPGSNGASGGGGGGVAGGTGIPSEGYNGGNGSGVNAYAGGGGGGSSAVGGNGATGAGGAGGAGTENLITGSSVYYAAGGGGGAQTGSGGAGGIGGGGNGSTSAGGDGAPATGYGSGGGGAGYYNRSGGAGSSGIVIVSYKTDGSDGIDATLSSGGTKTTSGIYTIHTFTSNGTLNLVPSVPSGSTLLKNYAIAYTTGHNDKRAMLSTITPSAYDVNNTVTTLPATSFTYNKNSLATPIYSASPALSGMFPGAINNGVVLGDVNGDAYTDIIKSYDNYPYGPVIQDRAVYVFNPVTDTYSTSSYAIPTDIVNYIVNGGSKYDGGTRVVDLDGNMAPDLVRTPYYNTASNIADVEQHNGSGWTHLTSGSPSYYPAYVNNPFSTVYSGDVNGDGLTDYLQDSAYQYVINCYGCLPGGGLYTGELWTTNLSKNTGSNFDVQTTTSNIGTPASTWSATPTFTGRDNMLMIDLNGDGLEDFIKADTVTPCNGQPSYTQEVYINNGKTWVRDTSYQLPQNFTVYNTGCYSSSRLSMEIADFNADGLVDILNLSYPQGLYLNQGKSFVLSAYSGDGFYNSINSQQASCNCSNPNLIFDINADGSPDIVNNAGTWMWQNAITTPTDLMSAITTPTGASMAVTYQSSPKYEDGSGNSLNPTSPLFMQTVKSIATTESVSGAVTTTNYTYAGGSYYYNNPFDKKFAGFEKVTETKADGTSTITYYHQGNSSNSGNYEYSDNVGKIGYVYRTDVLDASNALVSRTTTKYDSANPVTGAYFVYPIQTVNENSGVNTAKTYSYNTGAGTLSSAVDYGLVTVTDPLTFTDTGTDKKTTNYTYATNGSIYKVSNQTTLDQSSAKVNESNLYYDNQTLGTVIKGNNTKTDQWKVGTTYVNTQKSYSTYGNVLTSTDERGKVTNYAYDSYNLYPTTVTDPLTRTTQYTYDYNTGKPTQVTDQNGYVYQTTYDGFGRVLEQKIPDLTTPATLVTKTTYSYTNTPNNVSTYKTDYLDGSTTVDSYQYFDGLGRLIQDRSEAEASGTFNVKDVTYNNVGLLQSESIRYTGSGSARTTPTTDTTLYNTYTYDPLNRVLSVVNALGTTSYVYTGFKTAITDANGKVKNYYNDAYGNLVKVEEINSGSTYTTNYTWNLNNKLTNITDALANVRAFTYDGLGRRLTAQDLHASADATFGTWTYTYDDAGNLTQTLDPKSQTVNYTYDDLNRVLTEDYTGQAGTEVTYTYDVGTGNLGKLTSVVNPASTRAYIYNSNGGLKQQTDTLNAVNYVTVYDYDRQGNQIIITNPDNSQVKYIYNTAGLLEQVQRKESTDGSFINVITNFDYNPDGKIVTTTNANGTTTTNTYDATKLYQLTRRVTTGPGSGGTPTTTSFFPQVGDGIVTSSSASSWSTVHDATTGASAAATATTFNVSSGKATTTNYRIERGFLSFDTSPLPDTAVVTNAKLSVIPNAKLNNDNDGDDWITVTQGTQSSPTTLATADYDNAGNITLPTEGIYHSERKDITSVTTGQYLHFILNPTGRSWVSTTGSTKLALREGHDAINSPFVGTSGQYSRLTVRSGEYTGTTSDPVLEVTYYTSAPAPTTLQDLTYTYDNVGNITQIVDASGTDTAKTIAYTYDDLYRLTSSTITGAVNGDNSTKTYTYNAIGNMLTGDSGTYTYAGTGYANPHAVTSLAGATYAYDNNGNLTGNGTWSYTWDYNNQLLQSSKSGVTSTYSYDAKGQRVKQVSPTLGTVYYPTTYYNTDGTIPVKHIVANGMQVATIKGTGTTATVYTNASDTVQSTNVSTNSSGALVELEDYHPYGASRIDWQYSPDFDEQRKYIGQEFDRDSQLSYLNARYYNPAIAKFISQDPVFWEIGSSKDGVNALKDPQSQNSYSYAGNNPIVNSDPSGRWFESALDVASLGLSVRDYKQKPSVGNALFVGLDALSVAFPVPAIVGYIRHGDELAKSAKAVDKVTNTADSVKVLNKNSNEAISDFGIYQIETNGELYKYGKADMSRVTESTGLPTRLHQQVQKLKKQGFETVGTVINSLGKTTTQEAKRVENNVIQNYYKNTGKVPSGNQKSFKINNSSK